MSGETTTMAKVENFKTSNKGYELHCEYRNFPITFVNALRRILLSGIPTVVPADIQVLENTSQLPHEMIKHRVEMLPININPDDSAGIRDSKIELRMTINKEDKDVKIITTDDFVIESSRPTLIMKDRDFDKPILFMRLHPGESIHLKARLALQTENVHRVCDVGTYWVPDPERVKQAEKEWKEAGKDIREFHNFYYQQCYSRYEDETQPNFGRPNLFGMNIESYGGLDAKELLKYAVTVLRKNIKKYEKEALENITREKEEHSYSVSLKQGGNTIGALMQEVMYGDMNVDFVSYDIPHLLLPTMVIRFYTKKTPESILKTAVESIEEYCSLVEKAI
jgi:DNA-directed RNA polymerase alpha subunit